ncbi:hypothetical protein J1605_015507 [Eschrichtius robustus]|uniref:Uncharacterized protein n=1 Tax=Eschrichtius robustus TaxID=9764 RepID=A0AB34GAH0_ESCRO|nr:hypothetical protein J1605_015507 [Eschrichtius robustus]
MPWPWVSVSL